MTRTPLFHAVIGGQAGLCFALGSTTVFTTVEDERLYRVEDPSQLVITAPVEPRMAAFLETVVIAPRFERLAQEDAS